MNNDNKISTSIQYQVSNIVLFEEIFGKWNIFNDNLNKGPEEMKKYLYNLWMDTKEKLKNNDKLILKDLDKEVKIDDFDITYNRTKNNTSIFFFTFPDYEYYDAASKYVALALTKGIPRYFTLEYSKHYIDSTPDFVIGEFYINEKNVEHRNYGSCDNNRLSWFAGYIIGLLEAENM